MQICVFYIHLILIHYIYVVLLNVDDFPCYNSQLVVIMLHHFDWLVVGKEVSGLIKVQLEDSISRDKGTERGDAVADKHIGMRHQVQVHHEMGRYTVPSEGIIRVDCDAWRDQGHSLWQVAVQVKPHSFIVKVGGNVNVPDWLIRLVDG